MAGVIPCCSDGVPRQGDFFRKTEGFFMENITIDYCFTLADGSKREFNIELAGENLGLIQNLQTPLPEWTALDFHQCPNCPLEKTSSPHCPLAVSIVDIVNRFDDILSFEQVHLDVKTK